MAGICQVVESVIPGSYSRPHVTEGLCDFEGYAQNRVPPHLWPSECRFGMLDAIYFVVITCATIGYGDIVPTNWLARVIVLVIIGVLFLLIPRETTKLFDLISRSSPYSKPFAGWQDGHVVVCGDMPLASARRFLSEMYHTDHGATSRKKVVFLRPVPPSSGWVALLNTSRYESVVQYVLGSPLMRVDLERAAVPFADAVFVFTPASKDTSATQAYEADAVSLLIARSVRDASPRVPIIMQLLRQESMERNVWANADLVVCRQALRMSVLAMACLYPGIGTLVANLVTSLSERESERFIRGERGTSVLRPGDPIDDETESFVEDRGFGPSAKRWDGWSEAEKLAGLSSARREASLRSRAWRSEYAHGMQQEVYTVPISPHFHKRSFEEVAVAVHRLYGVTLFAVETQRLQHHPRWNRAPRSSVAMRQAQQLREIGKAHEQLRKDKQQTAVAARASSSRRLFQTPVDREAAGARSLGRVGFATGPGGPWMDESGAHQRASPPISSALGSSDTGSNLDGVDASRAIPQVPSAGDLQAFQVRPTRWLANSEAAADDDGASGIVTEGTMIGDTASGRSVSVRELGRRPSLLRDISRRRMGALGASRDPPPLSSAAEPATAMLSSSPANGTSSDGSGSRGDVGPKAGVIQADRSDSGASLASETRPPERPPSVRGVLSRGSWTGAPFRTASERDLSGGARGGRGASREARPTADGRVSPARAQRDQTPSPQSGRQQTRRGGGGASSSTRRSTSRGNKPESPSVQQLRRIMSGINSSPSGGNLADYMDPSSTLSHALRPRQPDTPSQSRPPQGHPQRRGSGRFGAAGSIADSPVDSDSHSPSDSDDGDAVEPALVQLVDSRHPAPHSDELADHVGGHDKGTSEGRLLRPRTFWGGQVPTSQGEIPPPVGLAADSLRSRSAPAGRRASNPTEDSDKIDHDDEPAGDALDNTPVEDFVNVKSELVLLMNPQHYYFRSGDRVLVLADNNAQALKISRHGCAFVGW